MLEHKYENPLEQWNWTDKHKQVNGLEHSSYTYWNVKIKLVGTHTLYLLEQTHTTWKRIKFTFDLPHYGLMTLYCCGLQKCAILSRWRFPYPNSTILEKKSTLLRYKQQETRFKFQNIQAVLTKVTKRSHEKKGRLTYRLHIFIVKITKYPARWFKTL